MRVFAHGALKGVVQAWKKHDLLADPNVKALLAPAPGQKRALDEARHIVNNAISIIRECIIYPRAIARIGVAMKSEKALLEEWAAKDYNNLAQGAPTISLALQTLGLRGTFKLCAELIQPTSPLLTYLLTSYVQLILGRFRQAV